HPAIPKHLRHEWQFVKPALVVQCTENFLLRPHLHPFTGAEPEARRNRVNLALHSVRLQLRCKFADEMHRTLIKTRQRQSVRLPMPPAGGEDAASGAIQRPGSRRPTAS